MVNTLPCLYPVVPHIVRIVVSYDDSVNFASLTLTLFFHLHSALLFPSLTGYTIILLYFCLVKCVYVGYSLFYRGGERNINGFKK